MREEAFAAFLAPRLDRRSVESYLSCLRRVERELNLDLDQVPLEADRLDDIMRLLRNRGVPESSARNCRSALVRYAQLRAGLPQPFSLTAEISDPLPRSTPPGRADWYGRATVADLLAGYGKTLDELRRRGVVRTANAPIGDYAEWLIASALDLTLAGNSSSHYDAIGPEGCRYQIKGRRVTGAGSRQLGGIRALEAEGFDMLGAVLFDSEMSVMRSVLMPRSLVIAHAVYGAHTNSWRLILSDKLIGADGISDITAQVRAAAASA